MDHSSARFVHTQNRMLEHYGIEYTPLMEEYIKNLIWSGQTELLHKKADGSVSHRVVLQDGTRVIVAYDPMMDDICTVLKSGMYKKSNKRNKKKRNPKRNKKTNFELRG